MMIFPRCGITLADLEKVAQTAKSQRHAAKLCGIHPDHFNARVVEFGLQSLFPRQYQSALTAEALAELGGMLKVDAAHVAGISESHFRRLVQRYELQHLFPKRGGECSYLARKGYAV